MKGDPKVLERLNTLMCAELTAMDQYFVHSRIYADWGLNELYERLNHEMEEEHGHTDMLLRRILFLEGTPDVSTRSAFPVGSDVAEMLRNDLDMEMTVVAALREVIAFCESAGDYQTREILEELLKDTEEDHTYWLEKQLGLIEKIGVENYLQSKV